MTENNNSPYILEESAALAEKASLKLRYIKLGLTIKSILTPSQYVVFYLKVIRNLSYSVIADIVGYKESTIRKRYSRAIKKIRKL